MNRIIKKALPTSIRDTALIYAACVLLAMYIFDMSPYLLAGMIGASLFCGMIGGYRLQTDPAYGVAMVFPMLFTVGMFIVGGLGFRSVFLFAVLAFAGVRGVQQAGRASITQRKQTWMFYSWLLVGAVIYIRSLQSEFLLPYSFSIYIACIVILIFLFMSWNDRKVREASGIYGDEEAPVTTLKKINRFWVSGFILLMVLIGGATQLSVILDGIVKLWRLLWGGSVGGGERRGSAKPDLNSIAPPDMMPYEDMTNNQDSVWVQVIIWIALCIIGVAVAVVIFFLLRALYRILSQWFPEWLRRLLERLRISARPIQKSKLIGYADTTEKLEPRKKAVKTKTVPITKPPEGARLEYFKMVQEAVRRGYKFRPWKTPSETGREIADQPTYRDLETSQVNTLTEAYNKDRYTNK
ncbi:DUF4129 domain-containing protein [Saccharibacillus sp. JS10]|uniref:DUF4129 domain-containing protein n=1 Tax=Saccharibacillus sp. JS10 TaxID=2950552 RepID=UPI00210C1FAD|nr:DUF4129 domain-containing protein [Saccharibacillus sp. JS10]MCQ4086846.1 DUF4129 domain-containing protein [Saccharibacillus sp. JS10]